MIELKDIGESVVEIVNKFPTKTENLLHKNSYFRHVYSLLVESNSFLEIGYRKGIFVEVCKHLGIKSTHIDITDDLLRATASKNNKCITSPSLSYLKKCRSKFDLIFQDGSKGCHCRKREYDLIVERSILRENGIIIVDDLHYPACKKAFEYAIKKYGFGSETFSVTDNGRYKMGLLKLKS
jgi:hypothetical protein